MRRNDWIRIVILPCIFLINGCGGSVSTVPQNFPMQTPSPHASAEKTWKATPTPMPTAAEKPETTIPTTTPTSTEKSWTITPTTTSTLTPVPKTPALTPHPTLSAEEAKTLVFDLLKDNSNCRLPCLWGLTPGQTDIGTFNDFMSWFGELVTPDVYISVRDFNDVGGFTLVYRDNSIHISVALGYLKGRENTELEMLALRGHAMQERGKDLDWKGLDLDVSPLYGDASFNQAFAYYLLPQMLSSYGRPTQVLLAPFPDDPDRLDIQWHPFSLVLIYWEQGIFVEYVSPRETVGSNFVGCPAKAHISLAVWDPESNLTLEYIVQKAGSEINELNMSYFKLVEEATVMSLNEFYEVFKDPQNTKCLETPKELWPGP